MTDINTYWLSRRPKLTAEQLFLMGRQHLLNEDFIVAARLLKIAAELGHYEATWLDHRLMSKNVRAGVTTGFNSIDRWLKWVFADNDDDEQSNATKYRLWFSRLDDEDEINELFALARAGEVLAQFALGQYCVEAGDDVVNANLWYKKASEQGFIDADYELASSQIGYHQGGIHPDSIKYILSLFDVANQGNHNSMKHIDTFWRQDVIRRSLISAGITELDATIIIARCYLETDRVVQVIVCDQATIKLKCNAAKIFMAGKTFDELLEYYPLKWDHAYNQFITEVVGMYRQMTSSARRTVVQTILILKSLGVCRDVRTLIAKLVYATRMDVDWRYLVN